MADIVKELLEQHEKQEAQERLYGSRKTAESQQKQDEAEIALPPRKDKETLYYYYARLVKMGYDRKDIARKMGVDVQSVHASISNAKGKGYLDADLNPTGKGGEKYDAPDAPERENKAVETAQPAKPDTLTKTLTKPTVALAKPQEAPFVLPNGFTLDAVRGMHGRYEFNNGKIDIYDLIDNAHIFGGSSDALIAFAEEIRNAAKLFGGK